MAKKDGERRMVFDTGGRRKDVVKVVYAVLAVLMGLSLLLVVGPAPLRTSSASRTKSAAPPTSSKTRPSGPNGNCEKTRKTRRCCWA